LLTRPDQIRVPKEIEEMLCADETVYAKAKQSRLLPGGKEVNPGEIFVTNTRLFMYEHKLFGRGNIADLHYGDVANVQLKKGIFSNEITVIPRFEGVDKIKISAANKDVSYKIVELITNGIELQGRRI
jgi:Bacterial PH domain